MDIEQHGGRRACDTTVFFSYSRSDREAALPIIQLLENAGYAVWWDGVLETGVQYIETTEEALDTAVAVVVLWSAKSIGSNWVRDEAMGGRERACLVPLSLDGSIAPLGFRQFQALDLSHWNGSAQAREAQELVRAVAALHEREGDLVPTPVAPTRPDTARKPALSRRTMLALGIGGGVAIAGGAGWLLVRGGPAAAAGNSIAVLPFLNDSRDPAQDYLSAGIASELRSMLARNPALRVVARSTSEAMQARGLDAVGIARELDIAFVVEGAVLVEDERVRVSSDLIEGASGIGRWSQTYNQSLDGLIELQAQLVEAISGELSQEVSGALQPSGEVQLGTATNPAAYDEYLRGWELYEKSNSTETDLQVLAHFDTAARLDPQFAGARAGQATAYTALGHTGQNSAETQGYYSAALAAAREAVALGPDLSEAHSVLALTLFETQLLVAEASEPYEKSLELGGGSAAIQARYAEYAALTGLDDAAVQAAERALALDPLNPKVFKSAGLVHYSARRYALASELYRQALSLSPETSGARAWIAAALLLAGDADAAIEQCQQEGFALMRDACLAVAFKRAGNAPEARAALAQMVAEYGDAGLYQQAQVLAQWGDAEGAMARLAGARRLGDAGLTYLRMDPMLDPLRQRPDFISLLQGLGFT